MTPSRLEVRCSRSIAKALGCVRLSDWDGHSSAKLVLTDWAGDPWLWIPEPFRELGRSGRWLDAPAGERSWSLTFRRRGDEEA